MKLRICLVLICCLAFSACGGDEKKQSLPPTPAPLDDQARLGTAAVQSAQDALPTLTPSVSPTKSPAPYDPGPYFTPRRPSPSDPITFMAPNLVGEFTRYQLQGNCQNPDGQRSAYADAEYQTVQLTCYFMPTLEAAQTHLKTLSASDSLSEAPLLFRLQGEESFLLGASGDGFIYAWTHGLWVLVARSPQGREPLDNFMASFPY